MAWRIEFDRAAERELDKLDPQIAKRILMFLHELVSNLDDPRSIGEALKGSRLGDFWNRAQPFPLSRFSAGTQTGGGSGKLSTWGMAAAA
ncbi:MAG TPA: type II toxin-antitoxin system RelE/ParE family toxin [Pseudomonas sp.]|jgi:hypothetical protein|uniref:type II toxin-antitoxin system RelE family toxin n=1 Tax=Pseudomonas sp. TaxID=306 RepID=UPI002ED94B1B